LLLLPIWRPKGIKTPFFRELTTAKTEEVKTDFYKTFIVLYYSRND